MILFETHMTHVAYIATLLGAEVESSELELKMASGLEVPLPI